MKTQKQKMDSAVILESDGDPQKPKAKTVSQHRLLGLVLIPTLCMYALYQGIQQILMPAQIEQLNPAAKIENLAILTTLSAIASMIALPCGGAVSDNTCTGYGKRTPWLVVSASASTVMMYFMGKAENIALLGCVYVVLWFFSNFFQGALSAVLPDRVPTEKRGIASAVIGIGTPLGVMLGVNIASRLSHEAAYTSLGVLLLVSTLLFVFGAPEPSSRHDNISSNFRKYLSLEEVRTFFSAFSFPDFRYAFFSRLMLFLAYFVVSGYMYYTLQDYIGMNNVPYSTVSMAVGVLSSINVVVWIFVTIVSGWLADKLNSRKLFVGISAICVAGSMLIPILFPTWYGMVAYSVFSGISIGIYFTVDLALMSLVLPNKQAEGRDFGLLAVATGLPQIASGSISAILISFLGGYISLYLFAMLCALMSGFLIFKIKSVK